MKLKGLFATKPESSRQALEPSAPDPESSNEALGISVVTTDANAQVDIIFIHGLTGHREKTWTHEDENEPWFKSLLPRDLPTARILAYGYDADVVNFTKVASQNTIRDHAVNLINDLAGHRRRAPGRPIIFVAHSLGGLVCQKALILCTNPTEDAQKDILSSTRGIAFLGTPHAGSDLARFATAVANFVRFSLHKKSNTKLLEVLTKNSEVLADISNEFFTMVRRRESSQMPIALHAFVEELDLDFLGRRVVEPDSARIVGYNCDTIHANHMEMTKFRSATDPGYVKVLSRLKIWIGDDDNTIVLRYANYFDLMFDTLLPGVKLAKSEPPASTMKELCKSSSIRSSVKWLIDSSEYRVWKSASSARLWLHGEHGDGKTVIMSYIFRSLFRYAPYPDGIASVFCSCNDSEEGVVASMALQLLRNKNRAKDWRLTFPLTKFQPGDDGRLEFNRLLWRLLTRLIEDGGVVLIIDGIDKINFLVRSSFLDIFNELEKNLRAGMRVLISSEKRDDIQSALRHYPSIDREKERREFLKTLEFQEWNAREISVQEVKEAGIKFFCNKEYRNWIESDGPSVLWLEGKPGSGKSTLTKFMVKELEKDTSLGQADPRNPLHNSPQKDKKEWIFNNPTDKSAIIARFYYSFRGGNTQTSQKLMLRSIVYQIWRDNSKLFPLIRDRYRELKRLAENEASGRKSFWSYADLKWALESLRQVNFCLSILIIVDGMDESNNDNRVDVLKFLLDLAHPNLKGACIVKVFISSRPENDINSRLRLAPHHVKLQEENEEDIRAVVEGWIRRMVSESECEEEILLEVKDYIMKYSDGVFMWVTLVLRDLERYIDNGGYTRLSLNNKLRSLPKELGGKDGFYRAMVDSLIEKYKEDEEQQERGRRILAWVTFAERPISVIELRDALATPPKLEVMELSTYVLEDNRPHKLEKAILSSCGGLAEVRDSHSGPIVQLIHQTAREFLLHEDKFAESYHLEEVQGDTEIAMTCCRYLSITFRPDFPPAEANGKLTKVEMMVRHLSEKSLLVYALANFQTHMDHLGSNNEKIRDEFMNFVQLLTERSISYAHLLLGKWIEALGWPPKLDVDDTYTRICLHVLLLCAIETRREKVAEVLVSLRPDLLHIEAGKGNLILMKPLLINPPNVISQVIGSWIPFCGGDDEHVAGATLLLNLGADADLKDAIGRAPISYAAENGHERGLKLLIEHGASADSQDISGRTPPSYAAGNGHNRSFQLLVQKGANADPKDKAGRTPLSYAAGDGQESTVKMLLEREDVEFNNEDASGRTPLSYAAENRHKSGLELLLQKGADVDLKDRTGRTPLSYAAGNGYSYVVSTLLQFGADVNLKDTAGRTPLSYAAENGHTSIVGRFLQVDDIEFNSEDTTGRTPLSYATANGHTAVVELLQSHTTE